MVSNFPFCTFNPLPDNSFQYLFTLQAHSNGSLSLIPLPLILFLFILHKLILLNSYGMYKASHSTMLHPINHPTIHSHCCHIHSKTNTHLTTLSIPSWHITHSSYVVHFSCAHSQLLCYISSPCI